MTREVESSLLKTVNLVFGALRAEYLEDNVYELFTKPNYWPELLTKRPCVLIGGRGTGKTTVLRCMSFQGQAKLNTTDINEWEYVGLYWRQDTSVARSFLGAGLDEEIWTRIFSHYVNLYLASLILEFCLWSEREGNAFVAFDKRKLARAASSLCLSGTPESLSEFLEATRDAIIDLEVYVNNAASVEHPLLSILGRPISLLVEAIEPLAPSARTVFFLLDEYENLLDYQQRVFNTLIKHSGNNITYKLGIRELGHRERSTINPEEQLIDPADYALIDIGTKFDRRHFSTFARSVCVDRLRRLHVPALEPEHLLPGLSQDQEAVALGSEALARKTRSALVAQGATKDELDFFDNLSPISAAVINYWAEGHAHEHELDVLRFAVAKPVEWASRLNNYGEAVLFTIRPRVRGLPKYFAGWDTSLQLASGNIRYVLDLLHRALLLHLADGRDLEQEIDPSNQTHAAQEVGRRILLQLQGLSVDGADLTRAVLSLGRLFGIMARRSQGHAPEITQFRVSGLSSSRRASDLLNAGIKHLAFERFSGDKMASVSGETKDFDYRLHPIFSAFFVVSPRNKRRMTLSTQDFLDLAASPAHAIPRILARSDYDFADPDQLPEQLLLFSEFYSEPH